MNSRNGSKVKRGFTISIFLPDGTPEGLRIVEKSNWTGTGIVCPRSLFGESKWRNEFARTGVYILTGSSESSELPRIYIGEGDPILPRLIQHGTKKDFWTQLIAFTSKDRNLNKAHVQFLEARLLQLATEAKRCEIDNGNQPQLPTLSEADEAEVEGFLDEMLLCLPVLGVQVFEKPMAPSSKALVLFLKSKGVEATGYESPQGFIVRSGSTAVATEVPSMQRFASDLRRDLVQQGILEKSGGNFRFSQDYIFGSPSTAASIISGRSVNGRDEWRAKDGRSLKQIQIGETAA